jgi:hypothetical protein
MDILSLVIGGVVVLVGMVYAMRRANKKPNGKTAKFVKALGGGGGGPKEPA